MEVRATAPGRRMIFIPEKEAPLTALSFAQALWRGLPRAYTILFFSSNVRFGWLLVGVSMMQPVPGLCGLACVMGAAALGWWLGFDRVLLRTGFSLFNPLLAGLTVGWLHHCHHLPWAVLVLLLIAAAVGGFLLAAGMNAWFHWQFGLSAHSLPAIRCLLCALPVGSFTLRPCVAATSGADGLVGSAVPAHALAGNVSGVR